MCPIWIWTTYFERSYQSWARQSDFWIAAGQSQDAPLQFLTKAEVVDYLWTGMHCTCDSMSAKLPFHLLILPSTQHWCWYGPHRYSAYVRFPVASVSDVPQRSSWIIYNASPTCAVILYTQEISTVWHRESSLLLPLLSAAATSLSHLRSGNLEPHILPTFCRAIASCCSMKIHVRKVFKSVVMWEVSNRSAAKSFWWSWFFVGSTSIAKRVLRSAAAGLSSVAIGKLISDADSQKGLTEALKKVKGFPQLVKLGRFVMQKASTIKASSLTSLQRTCFLQNFYQVTLSLHKIVFLLC